jgi:hypothetical protein
MQKIATALRVATGLFRIGLNVMLVVVQACSTVMPHALLTALVSPQARSFGSIVTPLLVATGRPLFGVHAAALVAMAHVPARFCALVVTMVFA